MYELSIEKPSVDGKTANATNAYEALKADPKSNEFPNPNPNWRN